MTPCNIQFSCVAMPTSMGGYAGSSIAVGNCLAHGMQIGTVYSCCMRCPVGIIEDAVDAGVAKIMKALESK